MAWTEPQHSKSQVKKAGKLIVRDVPPEQRLQALAVVNNWRSAHSFPLNTLQMSLRRKAALLTDDVLVAQRVKRLPSIEAKLRGTHSMDLARMQDLGGARAVMENREQVDQLVRSVSMSRQRHEIVNVTNYIAGPKPSGYRGMHLVYAYVSDKNPVWNTLLVEVQVRTRLQHAWATAVETVALFTDQALKASQGESEWLRFFALASAAFARREGSPSVPGTPEDPRELTRELTRLTKKLQVVSRMDAYGATIAQAQTLQGDDTDYFLLTLDTWRSTLSVTGYHDLNEASAAYALLESQVPESTDVVLVKTNSLAALRRAYPNYFADTTSFVTALQEALQER